MEYSLNPQKVIMNFCAPMSLFSHHLNTTQLWVAPVYDACTHTRAWVRASQRGFLDTCCWHGLCSQAPLVTGATHTHTQKQVLQLCTYLSNKAFLRALLNQQSQPTRSCITSRTLCSVQIIAQTISALHKQYVSCVTHVLINLLDKGTEHVTLETLCWNSCA